MVSVDRAKCIGCGFCVANCPKVFELDKEGKSIVKDPEAECEKLDEVVEGCPVGAISK